MKDKCFNINYILRELEANNNKKLNDVTAMQLFGKILFDAGMTQNKEFCNDTNIIKFKGSLNLKIKDDTQLAKPSKKFIEKARNDTTPNNQKVRKTILSYIDTSFFSTEEDNVINRMATSIRKRIGNISIKSIGNINEKFNKEYKELQDILDFVNSFNTNEELSTKVAWFIIIACFPWIDDDAKNKKKSESVNDYLEELRKLINSHTKVLGKTDDRNVYLKKYAEPFVLHKRDGLVAFNKNVYVSPDCEFRIYTDRWSTYPTAYETKPLISNLKKLLSADASPQPNLCLILGHGASGKTSFVTMVSADPSLLVEEADYHVLMLRQFSDIDASRLSEEIENRLRNISNNAYIILDGLDELCMMRNDSGEVDSASTVEQLCSTLLSENRKLIITSRPGFVDCEEVWSKICSNTKVYGMVVGRIKPFDHSKRVEFVNKLKEADESLSNRPECDWVCNLSDNENINEIYSSPFFIYLIVASSKAPAVAQKPITDLERTNKWALFRRLFHDIYFDSYYWDDDNTSTPRKGLNQLKDQLYTVSGHVAWKMCSSGQGKYYCTSDQIKEIIESLNFEPELIDEIINFYPVSSYINKSGNRNAYEFAHNYVRDFFLCEFTLENLNNMISTPNTNQQIINWAKNYLYPQNLKITSNSVAYGGHWVLEFFTDYDFYYILNKKIPYHRIEEYSPTNWNSIFYYLYHEMCSNTIVKMGKSYNENVFNNLKEIYISINQSHDTLDPRIIQHSEKEFDIIRNIQVNDKIVFGLNEWYVLSIENNYIRLISAVAFIKKYHDIDYDNYTINNISWSNSTLRSWLNHDFFTYFFSDYERRAISNVKNSDPITLLDSIEWKALDNNLKSEMRNNTLRIMNENSMDFPHPNAEFTIHTTDATLQYTNSRYCGHRWSTSFDINRYGLVFPVIKLYYNNLMEIKDINENDDTEKKSPVNQPATETVPAEKEIIELPIAPGDPYGIKAVCAKYGIYPMTPSYIPEGFELVSEVEDDNSYSIDLTFRYVKGEERINIYYTYYKIGIENVPIGIPTDSQNIQGIPINGQLFSVIKEDDQLKAFYIDGDMRCIICTYNIGYSESEKILNSYH